MNSVNALVLMSKIAGSNNEGLIQVFWRHVAVLLIADSLLQLMKRQIDDLVATDEHLQQLLTWLSQKSRTASVPYRPAVIRAFYLDLALARTLNSIGGTLDLARTLDIDITCNLARPLALDLSLDRALGLSYVLDRVVNPFHVADCVLERAITHARILETQKLEESLQQLKSQIPRTHYARESILAWWRAEGQAWTEQLRAVTIEYRDCGYCWQFNEGQKEALKQYYDANQLLVSCLNMTYINNSIRDEIEASLLLPITEIEAIN